MNCKPAPESILEFVSCSCHKNKCQTQQCQCRSIELHCTDECRCANCNNRKVYDNESSSEVGYDSLDEDGEFSDEFTDTEYESDDI